MATRSATKPEKMDTGEPVNSDAVILAKALLKYSRDGWNAANAQLLFGGLQRSAVLGGREVGSFFCYDALASLTKSTGLYTKQTILNLL